MAVPLLSVSLLISVRGSMCGFTPLLVPLMVYCYSICS